MLGAGAGSSAHVGRQLPMGSRVHVPPQVSHVPITEASDQPSAPGCGEPLGCGKHQGPPCPAQAPAAASAWFSQLCPAWCSAQGQDRGEGLKSETNRNQWRNWVLFSPMYDTWEQLCSYRGALRRGRGWEGRGQCRGVLIPLQAEGPPGLRDCSVRDCSVRGLDQRRAAGGGR